MPDESEDPNNNRREELFNISIALFQYNREYIIGNAHLPIEDLIDTISQFEGKNGTYDRKTKRSLLVRTLFLYGTTYSQRENCIIGKLQLEVNYCQEKLYLSKREAVIAVRFRGAHGAFAYRSKAVDEASAMERSESGLMRAYR